MTGLRTDPFPGNEVPSDLSYSQSFLNQAEAPKEMIVALWRTTENPLL